VGEHGKITNFLPVSSGKSKSAFAKKPVFLPLLLFYGKYLIDYHL
jgi:hypothetical protein